MHGQRENSIPPTNKVCGGYNKIVGEVVPQGSSHDSTGYDLSSLGSGPVIHSSMSIAISGSETLQIVIRL